MPQVSVLLTTFNQAPFVEEALESLRRQTCQDFEVVITDDASTDRTPEIVAAWLARTGSSYTFVRNAENRGICANRNAAIARSSAPFVCSLSGDDAYMPDRIERQLDMFGRAPREVGAVFGDMMVVGADGADTGVTYLQSKFGEAPPPEDEEVFFTLLRSNWMPAPTVMVRRTAFEAVGPYDEDLINEDYDMWLRLSHRFRFRHVPYVVVRYRWLADSLSRAPRWEDALVRSRGRVLAKWVGRCGPGHDRVVVDRLWGIGRDQLRKHQDAEGARNLTLAAAGDGRAKRRLVARLASFRAGRSILRGTGAL